MYLHTEFIRLLEQRGHIFPSDPNSITELLRHTDGDIRSKLHRRAQLIDRDQQLANRLTTHQRRLHFMLTAASVIWFVFGFIGTYGMMQQDSLNFLLILFAVLGINTLMLIVWLLGLCLNKTPNMPHAALFSGSRDSIGQTLTELYTQAAMQPRAKWTRGAMSHRLALCGLSGMFAAVLLLLIVRQYQFNWESTLLNGNHFAQIIAVLAWLPSKLGFAVPTDDMVRAAQNAYHAEHAATWGSLLLGSLLCYGCLPRLLAWAICVYQRRQKQPEIDLNLPYYQNISQKWQQKIVDDASDYRADDIPHIAPKVSLDAQGARWAIVLDAPPKNPQWFEQILGQDWVNKGVLAERGDVAILLDELAQQSVQLLVGVRAHHVPDRGVMRTLTKLAQAAQAGMVVQFLHDDVDALNMEIVVQWREILSQHGWAWLE